MNEGLQKRYETILNSLTNEEKEWANQNYRIYTEALRISIEIAAKSHNNLTEGSVIILEEAVYAIRKRMNMANVRKTDLNSM
jgi:hypothetical protein